MKENRAEEEERKEKEKYMKCLYMNKELWEDT